MIEEFAKQLEHVVSITIVLQKAPKWGPEHVRAVVVPKALKSTGVNTPEPIIITGLPAEVEIELKAEKTIAKIWEFAREVAAAKAAPKAAPETKAPAKSAPKKSASSKKSAPSPTETDIKLLEKCMKDCREFVKETNKEKATSKFRAIKSLYDEKLKGLITPELLGELKQLMSDVKNMPEQATMDFE